MIVYFTVFIIGFLVIFLSMPFFIEILKENDIVGIDVHKKNKPKIPEMGGIVVLLGFLFDFIVLFFLKRELFFSFLSFIMTVFLAGIIGLIDDLYPLNAKVKPFLTLFVGIPILLLRTYTPSIYFPLIGNTRLTIVYPILIPIVMAVTSNAVNMLDPFNGVMSGTCCVMTFAMIISSILLRKPIAILLYSTLLGILMAFYYFNKYPSKVFSGDVGSLSIGAALGAIAIIGNIEIIAVTAFMPHIMNAFYGLSSIGGLYERREVPRPTKLLEDGRIAATDDPNAPITLARFILARGPMYEKDIVRVLLIYSAIAGVLAILTSIFMVYPI